MNMEIINNLKVDKEVMKNQKNVETSGVFLNLEIKRNISFDDEN